MLFLTEAIYKNSLKPNKISLAGCMRWHKNVKTILYGQGGSMNINYLPGSFLIHAALAYIQWASWCLIPGF